MTNNRGSDIFLIFKIIFKKMWDISKWDIFQLKSKNFLFGLLHNQKADSRCYWSMPRIL